MTETRIMMFELRIRWMRVRMRRIENGR